jgi:hypothetical protein
VSSPKGKTCGRIEAGGRAGTRSGGAYTATFYAWKAKVGGMEVSEAKRLEQLEDENAKLKRVLADANGGFRREVQPRRQHWFLKRRPGFPFRTPAFCSVSKGQRRLGEKEYRASSVTPGVALRVGIQGCSATPPLKVLLGKNRDARPPSGTRSSILERRSR